MQDIAIVYLVAGISSRFGGKIKQFAQVGPDGETLIEYSLKQSLPAGFTKIVFVVGEKTEKPFKDMFGEIYQGIPVQYALQKYNSEERDKPWGTVDALCSAKSLLDCKFIVCNGDDLYGEDTFKILVDHLTKKETCATVGYKLWEVLPEEGSVNRGIFEINNSKVLSIREEFGLTKDNLASRGISKDDLCSMNIFALDKEVLRELQKTLAGFKIKHSGDRKKEILLPEEISNLIKENKIILDIYPATEKWIGVTNPQDEEIVREILKNKKN